MVVKQTAESLIIITYKKPLSPLYTDILFIFFLLKWPYKIKNCKKYFRIFRIIYRCEYIQNARQSPLCEKLVSRTPRKYGILIVSTSNTCMYFTLSAVDVI